VALIVALGLLAAVPAVRGAILRAAGWALVADDPVAPADIIVLPEWAEIAGAIDAADLVRSGIASRVAVLPGPPKRAELELTRRGIPYVGETQDLVQLLRWLGVAKVEVIPTGAGGTEAEGQVLLSWCDQHQFRSIVVVSAPDHSRRVRRVFHRTMAGHPTKIVIRSARFSEFDPNKWWHTRDGVRTEIVELQKLLLDVARHPIS
jgi:hypothetical protein